MQKSTVTLYITCADGKNGMGSGIAITKQHVVTAKHVIKCSDDSDAVKIRIRRYDGAVIKATLYKHARKGIDATIVVTDENQFFVHAKVNAERPPIGLPLELLSGSTRVYKEGKTSEYRGDDLLVSLQLRVLPGDSGGGYFDEAGDLRAIVYGWSSAHNKEVLNIATIAATWTDILPPD